MPFVDNRRCHGAHLGVYKLAHVLHGEAVEVDYTARRVRDEVLTRKLGKCKTQLALSKMWERFESREKGASWLLNAASKLNGPSASVMGESYVAYGRKSGGRK